MEMYDEYCVSVVPTETPQRRCTTKQQVPPSTSQTQQTPYQETTPKDVFKRRDQTNQDPEVEETSLKEGMDRRPATITSSTTLGMDTMSSTLPSTTRPLVIPNTYTGTTTEGIGSVRTLPQGRMFTLSSMVRPMPTTATRTIAITREESHQDALETVRQMVGPTSRTTVLPMLTTNTVTQEPCVNPNDDINTSTNEVRPRISSPHLLTLSGRDILTYKGQVYSLGMMIQQLYLLEDWILMKGGRYTILMISQEFTDLLWTPQTIYND